MKVGNKMFTGKTHRGEMKATELISEAAEWHLISLLLERPGEEWRNEISALSREIEDADLTAAVRAAACSHEGEYLALIGPGGIASPREVSYRSWEDPGRVLSELSACYQAFTFQPRVEDPIDHIAVESGFVGYLFLKEGFARSEGNEEAAETIATARAHFLESHLSSIVHPLLHKLEEAGRSSAFIETLRLLAKRVPEPRVIPTILSSDLERLCANCGAS